MHDFRHHTVQVPATTANLGPGFDALGLAVDLHLVVATLPRAGQTERVRTLGAAGAELPTGDDNLVWRSFVAFCDTHGVPVPDVALKAASAIPLERGLGSSSAAIVAGLVAARGVTGVEVGDRHLVAVAAGLEGHPDNVAPALLGGLVACATSSDGEVVVRRINPATRLRPLMLVPEARQATTAARAVLPDVLPRAAVADQAARSGHVLGALIGAWPMDVRLAGDHLHEPSRTAVMGPTGNVVAALRDEGIHAWLSGAGPSVAAVVPDHAIGDVEVARRVAAANGFALHALGFDRTGALACPDGGCALTGSASCVQCPRRAV